MVMFPSASSLACKFYHFPPLCVANLLDKFTMLCIEYHQSLEWLFIWGVHKHPMVDGKCRESVDETIRLIAKEPDHMLDAKIFVISITRPSWLCISLMIVAMALWSF